MASNRLSQIVPHIRSRRMKISNFPSPAVPQENLLAIFVFARYPRNPGRPGEEILKAARARKI
jgi:hypothetical protein